MIPRASSVPPCSPERSLICLERRGGTDRGVLSTSLLQLYLSLTDALLHPHRLSVPQYHKDKTSPLQLHMHPAHTGTLHTHTRTLQLHASCTHTHTHAPYTHAPYSYTCSLYTCAHTLHIICMHTTCMHTLQMRTLCTPNMRTHLTEIGLLTAQMAKKGQQI